MDETTNTFDEVLQMYILAVRARRNMLTLNASRELIVLVNEAANLARKTVIKASHGDPSNLMKLLNAVEILAVVEEA